MECKWRVVRKCRTKQWSGSSTSDKGRIPRPGICWKGKEGHSQGEERLAQERKLNFLQYTLAHRTRTLLQFLTASQSAPKVTFNRHKRSNHPGCRSRCTQNQILTPHPAYKAAETRMHLPPYPSPSLLPFLSSHTGLLGAPHTKLHTVLRSLLCLLPHLKCPSP